MWDVAAAAESGESHLYAAPIVFSLTGAPAPAADRAVAGFNEKPKFDRADWSAILHVLLASSCKVSSAILAFKAWKRFHIIHQPLVGEK